MAHVSRPPEEWLCGSTRVAPRGTTSGPWRDHLETCADCEAAWSSSSTPRVSADQLLAVLRSQVTPLPALPRPRHPDPADPTTWPTLPGYEIVGPLGRGAMGVVYKARRVRSSFRLVALEAARPGEATVNFARVRTEAEVLAALRHPGVVQIHEFVEHEGIAYLALELVEGGNLNTRLGGRPQPPRRNGRQAGGGRHTRRSHAAHLSGVVPPRHQAGEHPRS